MDSQSMAEEYFKVSEVAERFKVTPQAVYKWINEGRLRAVRIGDAIRIRSDDLVAFEQPVVPGSRLEQQSES